MADLVSEQDDQNASPPIRAAQYVRMSTEHQRYSIDNQMVALDEYAQAHGMQIVRTYADHGKSGLTLQGRAGLINLLEDVRDERADYEVLLVYDISRWGRFQDADEGAFYEYVCRKSGIRVIYCAEPFMEDGSAITAVIKGIKRAMAAEYSRELSAKVKYGLTRRAARGYFIGHNSPLGFRRMLVGPDGRHKAILEPGEHKHLVADHITLVLGPPAEIELVKRIFRLFVIGGLNEGKIASTLNRENLTNRGRRWTRTNVHVILRDEKYVGTGIYNKTTSSMRTGTRKNPESEWVRVVGAFPSIVSAELFEAAQKAIESREKYLEPEEMIRGLKRVLERHGKLTQRLINAEPGIPCPRTYAQTFGSVEQAYGQVGFTGYNRGSERLKRAIGEQIKQGFAARGVQAKPFWRSSFRIDNDWWLSLVTARRYERPNGDSWWARLDLRYEPTLTVLVLTSSDGTQAEGFLFLPPQVRPRHLYLRVDDPAWDGFRSDDLSPLFDDRWRLLASPDRRPKAPARVGWSTKRRPRPIDRDPEQ